LHRIHDDDVWDMTEPLRGVDSKWDVTIMQRPYQDNITAEQLQAQLVSIPGDKKVVIFVLTSLGGSPPSLSSFPILTTPTQSDNLFVFLGNQEGLNSGSMFQLTQENRLVDLLARL